MRGYAFTSGMLVAGLLLSACSGSASSSGTAFVPQSLPDAIPATANVIKNGGFETGKLPPWIAVGQRGGAGTVTNKEWHTGKYSAFMGTTSPPAVNGAHGIEQTITVPKNGVLTFWHAGTSTDEAKYGYYEVDILKGTKKLGTCPKTGVNYSDTGSKIVWKKLTCSLAKYGGQKVTLEFYVTDNGYAKADVNWYVDDVSVI